MNSTLYIAPNYIIPVKKITKFALLQPVSQTDT